MTPYWFVAPEDLGLYPRERLVYREMKRMIQGRSHESVWGGGLGVAKAIRADWLRHR